MAPDACASPRVTVITVVLNGSAHLRQCVQSVIAQEGVLLEHIIIDGGSTDGSLDIIRECAPHLAYWISEPDKGIAQAMNKGIQRAQGEWLLFLHSDDFLNGNGVLAQALQSLRSSDVLGCYSIDSVSLKGALRKRRPLGFVWWLNFKSTFLHQGTLFHRDLFTHHGVYDESFRIGMDYEFYLRLYRTKHRGVMCPELSLAVMRDTGISSKRDWTHLRARLAEERAIHHLHAPSAIFRLIYEIYWPLYLVYRRLRCWLMSGIG